jgi:putative hydrolase of HD superfamily
VDIPAIVELLDHGNQLKRTPRTGWLQRGVADAESVAAHSYGVAYTALVLAQWLDEPLDRGRLLALAVLHDLPEGLTGDIPTPAWRRMPPGAKPAVEGAAMEQIWAGAPAEEEMLGLWQELEEGQTAVARLVKDADKLDMYLQALMYERHTGNRQLQEFWNVPTAFNYPLSQAIYDELKRRRKLTR